MIIYNSELIENDNDLISQQGWLEGSGFFETIKTVDGQAWALSRHMRRAMNTAIRLGIKLPGEEIIRRCVIELLEAEPHDNGMLRLSFSTAGDWAIFHAPYQERTQPAHLTIFDTFSIPTGVPLKTFPYTHRLEILEDINSRGFDEAIVINDKKKVCEGSVTNLLFKIDSKWVTSPLSDGVLPGVMRALVIEHLKVQVRSIGVEEIPKIQAGFLLSSLRIAQPIAAIDGRELVQSHDFEAQIRAMALRTSVG